MLSILAAVVLHSAPLADLKKMALNMETGDPKQLVFTALGEPDEMRREVCGSKTPNPWDCMTWTFHASDVPNRELVVVFQRHDGMWVVDSWSI